MKYANDSALKWNIVYIISTCSENGLINGLSENQILEIINLLKSCASDRKFKDLVAPSIAGLASNHCLDFLKGQPEKLLTLVKILDECFTSDDLYIERKVGMSIKEFLVGKLENSDNTELNDAISHLRKDPKSENSQKFLDQLIQNSLLKDLTEEGKEEFKKLITKCLFYLD